MDDVNKTSKTIFTFIRGKEYEYRSFVWNLKQLSEINFM